MKERSMKFDRKTARLAAVAASVLIPTAAWAADGIWNGPAVIVGTGGNVDACGGAFFALWGTIGAVARVAHVYVTLLSDAAAGAV